MHHTLRFNNFKLSTKMPNVCVSSLFSAFHTSHSHEAKKEITGIEEYRNPIKLLKNEYMNIIDGDDSNDLPVPRESDILVIGGGATGLSIAYWLKQRHPTGFTLTVVEKDSKYTSCATSASIGGVRQQFSLAENIKMSKFSAEFFRNIKDYLGVDGIEPPSVNFQPNPYLFLANASQVDEMKKNHLTQIQCGSHVQLLDTDKLRLKYPWLNTTDIAMGSLGLQDEGHIDPWMLLAALKAKCVSLGVEFVDGEVVKFSHTEQKMKAPSIQEVIKKKKIKFVHVKALDGHIYPVSSAIIVNAAGPWAGHVGYLAGVGAFEGPLSVPIPVEPRKRYVFVFDCKDGPGLEMPMLIDVSGMYVRREGLGTRYICGMSPEPSNEPDTKNLDVDFNFFNDKIWPLLAERIPAFNNIKVMNAWAGFYDYNYFDENLIIGNHPYFTNFFTAAGSSGHGIQHVPAIGRAAMEFLLDDEFKTIDLSSFSFDRVLYNEPVCEKNII